MLWKRTGDVEIKDAPCHPNIGHCRPMMRATCRTTPSQLIPYQVRDGGMKCTSYDRWKYPERQVFRATRFYTVAPNICGSSQHGTCFMLPFRRLELRDGPYVFAKMFAALSLGYAIPGRKARNVVAEYKPEARSRYVMPERTGRGEGEGGGRERERERCLFLAALWPSWPSELAN
jgi:hypothetical protein